jgi:hypothetical protein
MRDGSMFDDGRTPSDQDIGIALNLGNRQAARRDNMAL